MIKSSKTRYLAVALACVFTGMCWQGVAQARNTKMLLPVSDVFAQKAMQQALGADMSIVFGSAVPEGVALLSEEIVVRGEARPNYRGISTTDETVCRMAAQNALLDLTRQARSRGANALVGVVSFYDHLNIMDSPTQYECHAGMTRSVVDFKVKLGKIDRVDGNVAVAVQRLLPPASGFADISDVRHVPFLDQQGREAYQLWLTRTTPRAFVVAEDGHWGQAWGSPPDEALPKDLAVRALQNCYNRGARNCQLYAVDGTVVYQASAVANPAQQSNRPATRVLIGE